MSAFDGFTPEETYANRYPKLFRTSWQPSDSSARAAYSKTKSGIQKLRTAIDQNPILWSGDDAISWWALMPFGWGVAVPQVSQGKIKIYTEAIPAVRDVINGDRSASSALASFWRERGDSARVGQQRALEDEARALLASAPLPDPLPELAGRIRQSGIEPTVQMVRRDFARFVGLSDREANELANNIPATKYAGSLLAMKGRIGMPEIRRDVTLFNLFAGKLGPKTFTGTPRTFGGGYEGATLRQGTVPASSAPVIGGVGGAVAGGAAGYLLAGRSPVAGVVGAVVLGGVGYVVGNAMSTPKAPDPGTA